jgi:hypothetical protein
MTYTLIDSEVLASAAASVTFSSIPADYRDLVLVITGTVTSSVANARLEFNGDTTITNYSRVEMIGDGSSASSTSASSYIILGSNGTFDSTVIANATVQVMDYSATDKHKTVLTRSGRASGSLAEVFAAAGRWANTSAITSLSVITFSSTFAAGSTFYLYGIEG